LSRATGAWRRRRLRRRPSGSSRPAAGRGGSRPAASRRFDQYGRKHLAADRRERLEVRQPRGPQPRWTGVRQDLTGRSRLPHVPVLQCWFRKGAAQSLEIYFGCLPALATPERSVGRDADGSGASWSTPDNVRIDSPPTQLAAAAALAVTSALPARRRPALPHCCGAAVW